MFTVCAVVLVLMVVRVATLQTVDRKTYAGWGESKRLSTRTLAADRGTIYDRNHLELAISAPQTTLWADPRLIKDDKRDAIVDQIAAIVGMDAEAADRVRQAIANGGQFAYVARQIDDGLAKQVLDLKLDGIFSYVEPRRFNPGDLAEATVGHTDLDGLGADGSGIEKMYDKALTGTPGHIEREVDVRNRTIPMGRHEVVAAVPGKSVVLTVDSTLTYEVEQMLLDHLNSIAVRGVTPKGGMVTVMDRAGDVLASASVSTDPTTGRLQINRGANRPFIEAFEPGSVMKIVASAGALDSGVSTLDQSWHLEAKLTSGVDEIHNAEENAGGGDLTLRDIVVQSSNVGTVRLAQELGTSRFESYLHSFGFGVKTPVGFPDESKGILPPSSKWYGSQKDTIAYGQGVSVTQVQLAAAMNTLANGGQYVAPRLVSATIDPDGTVRPAPASDTHRVVSEQAAADLTQALRGVVCDKRGTVGSHREKYLNLPNYAVAGKTGTAFKAQNKNYVVGYDNKGRKKIDNYRDENGNKHYMASFAGFLPAENPRLTIAVTVDEPSEEFRFGASGAAPLFAKVGAEAMRLLGVPPSPDGSGCPPTS